MTSHNIIGGTAFITKGHDDCAVDMYVKDESIKGGKGRLFMRTTIAELPESVQGKLCVLALMPPSSVPLKYFEDIGDLCTERERIRYRVMMTAEESNEFYVNYEAKGAAHMASHNIIGN